jgi:hypothetical protein
MSCPILVLTKKSKPMKKYWIITALLMIIKLALHFFTNTNYELHRDEMLYFNMADHLSAGYATVPPVIGFLAFIVKNIFGYSVFGIRFFPALLGAASIYIISRIVKDCGGGITALLIAAGSFLLSPGFLLLDTLFTPNMIEHFLWLLITYFLLMMIIHNKPILWLWIGVLLGYSFLTKYSVLFYIAGFLPAMLLPGPRRLINNKYFYFAILFCLIIMLPNLVWQNDHGFPVINHMGELKRTQLDNMNYRNFLLDVFSLNLASTVIWVTGLFSLLVIKDARGIRSLGVGSLLVIFLFMVSNGKGYYILGLIPFLLAAGGIFLERFLKGRMLIPGYAFVFLILAHSLIALPFGLPVLPFDRLNEYSGKTENMIIYPFYRWEDGKVHHISQVYADMTGWHQLASLVSEAYTSLTEEEQKRCTIFVEANYGVAGAIHFYGKEYDLPQPVTFLESYVFWAPDTIPEGPVIYINNRIGGVTDQFNNITEIGSVTDKYFREDGLKVFLCSNSKTDIPQVYRQLAMKEKSRF